MASSGMVGIKNNQPGYCVRDLYAWVAIDADGDEGIPSTTLPGLGTTPLVASKLGAIELMRPVAEEMALLFDCRMELRRFSGPGKVVAVVR